MVLEHLSVQGFLIMYLLLSLLQLVSEHLLSFMPRYSAPIDWGSQPFLFNMGLYLTGREPHWVFLRVLMVSYLSTFQASFNGLALTSEVSSQFHLLCQDLQLSGSPFFGADNLLIISVPPLLGTLIFPLLLACCHSLVGLTTLGGLVPLTCITRLLGILCDLILLTSSMGFLSFAILPDLCLTRRFEEI